MSVTIDYFFNSNKPLLDMAAEINEVMGCSLRGEGKPESNFIADPFFGMDLRLSIHDAENGYTDDGELKFSHYNYELTVKTYWQQADARPIQLPILLSMVYILHWRLGITGMLVFDMQVLLAQFEARQVDDNQTELFDTLSNTPVWMFADYLKLAQERLPERWRQVSMIHEGAAAGEFHGEPCGRVHVVE